MDAVITRFDVQTSGYGKAHVVAANMHIVCSDNPPTIPTRQHVVRLVRQHLDGIAAPDPGTPVVRIMVGDNNLLPQQARQALQQCTANEPLWEVFAAAAGRQGDNVAVSGGSARVVPIAVGRSYGDRGMRNDAHDAVGVVITPWEAK